MRKKLFTLFLVSFLMIAGCSNGGTGSEMQESNETEVKIAKAMIKKENQDNFYVVATPQSGNDLIYAYHVLKDNKVIEKSEYTRDAYYTYKVTEPGVYKVRVFIKDRQSETNVFKDTQTIEM